jgi:HJR/Mrr/RecB family endonuclease
MGIPRDEQVAQLNERIAELKRRAENSDHERRQHARRLTKLSLLAHYARTSIWLRRVGLDYEYWHVGVLATLPLAISSIGFLLLYVVTDSLTWSFAFALPSFAITFALTADMLYRGTTEKLIDQLGTIQTDRQQARQQRATAHGARTAALAQLQDLVARRSELIASDKFRREQLLKQDWQRMKGTEWERFLCDVLASLGASVELTKRASNPDSDLIADLGGRRIAIQGRGYDHTINNVTVQQAIDSMAHYRCHGCAVITNQRFTASARELAKHHGCKLVGQHNFASWVRGEWQL